MSERDDFDNPWKKALEEFPRECLDLLFPQVAARVDWSKPIEFLDTELARITPEGDISDMHVDKLLRVHSLAGETQVLWIHIEVQTQPEANFARRFFIYYCRILDATGQDPISLAILADDRASWRPTNFQAGDAECGVDFHFPTCKLLDYDKDREKLLATGNPFAYLIHAHLDTLQTQGDPERRGERKFGILRRLLQHGLKGEDVRRMFLIIDCLMKLPQQISRRMYADFRKLEEAKNMPFISTPELFGRELGEELGKELGKELGQKENVLEVLRVVLPNRFSDEGVHLYGRLAENLTLDRLKAIQHAAITGEPLDVIRKLIEAN